MASGIRGAGLQACRQITSAKYLSMRLNITNAAMNSTTVIAADTAAMFQSGARPNTSDDRNPSTIAVNGFSTNSHRNLDEVADSGYATGVRYSHSCSAICTTGFTSR